MLIIFGGLPGTGKTTLSRALAAARRATYLRIDIIEQALREAGHQGPITAEGYVIAYALASANLRLGATVVADSVNPIALTRDAWRKVATESGAPFVEIEIICSDPAEHRRRVETRENDIEGHVQPTWREVVERDYEPWTRDRIVIDTAGRPAEEALAELTRALP
ncbi:AAA family ATPase [Kaistia dalseonensis]|uniref:Kinase n=1 Tax=Kaistia dalseonensis TaxID=410840 RepID=A0ABU0HD90_9HYPH|nr:AAA family ATPase [Kaistia dalseonensis]MCX5497647.1 AAA family ATPase [Kaistia dalseonensis]MDQ0440289.1 putative kinase [Kaistia dalseonensis]